jgi:GNAT superfamily N-acetyltransferase
VSVEIKTVSGFRDVGRFIDLPFRLHANHPLWVPPWRLERRIFLNRRLNAFFSHGEAQYFLAVRDNAVIGRVSAHINHSFNEHRGKNWGWFGFIEFEDDEEVVRALLDAGEAWLRERGCEAMVGPADFAMNNECGILIEGYELRPMVSQPWHPPYYQQRLEAAGMSKAMDLLMWNLEVADRSSVHPAIVELAEKVESEHGIRVRPMSRLRLRREMDKFAEIYNAAWSKNWDFVPYGKKDLNDLAFELQFAYDKHWFMVAEKLDTGEPVGMAITVPDLNEAFARMKGRALPFGWWHLMRKSHITDRVRVGWLGVKPEHQHTGVAAKLFLEHFEAAARRPQTGGEMGWILETNTAMNRGMEGMGGRVVKRYRIYERALR